MQQQSLLAQLPYNPQRVFIWQSFYCKDTWTEATDFNAVLSRDPWIFRAVNILF